MMQGLLTGSRSTNCSVFPCKMRFESKILNFCDDWGVSASLSDHARIIRFFICILRGSLPELVRFQIEAFCCCCIFRAVRNIFWWLWYVGQAVLFVAGAVFGPLLVWVGYKTCGSGGVLKCDRLVAILFPARARGISFGHTAMFRCHRSASFSVLQPRAFLVCVIEPRKLSIILVV